MKDVHSKHGSCQGWFGRGPTAFCAAQCTSVTHKRHLHKLQVVRNSINRTKFRRASLARPNVDAARSPTVCVTKINFVDPDSRAKPNLRHWTDGRTDTRRPALRASETETNCLSCYEGIRACSFCRRWRLSFGVLLRLLRQIPTVSAYS